MITTTTDSPYHEELATIASDGADRHDLPPEHDYFISHGASCWTCGETYPGTGSEHGLRFNDESRMYETFDAAHPGAWIC